VSIKTRNDFDIDGIRVALQSRQMPIANESLLQAEIEKVLREQYGDDVKREHPFGKRDRVDFYIPSRKLVVEVKLARSGGNFTSIMRQVRRYAEHADVHAVLVITTSYYLECVLPRWVDKTTQLFVINVGGAV
jgi:hypothetical protein